MLAHVAGDILELLSMAHYLSLVVLPAEIDFCLKIMAQYLKYTMLHSILTSLSFVLFTTKVITITVINCQEHVAQRPV